MSFQDERPPEHRPNVWRGQSAARTTPAQRWEPGNQGRATPPDSPSESPRAGRYRSAGRTVWLPVGLMVVALVLLVVSLAQWQRPTQNPAPAVTTTVVRQVP